MVRDEPSLTGNRLLVLLTIATYMDHKGERARPAMTTLAEKTGLHTATISRHLKAARDEGWLEQVSRGHRRGDGTRVTSVYRATCPAESLHRNECEVEDDLNIATGDLYIAPEASLHRNECVTIIPDHGLTTSKCVLDLACSKLSTPDRRQHDETRVKVQALVAIHGEDAVRAQVLEIPDACMPFGGELAKLLRNRLTPPTPVCERCNGTGQTNMGYVCGCPATAGRRRAS
jgi:hypothetical protein